MSVLLCPAGNGAHILHTSREGCCCGQLQVSGYKSETENESYFGFVLIIHHTYTSVEHLLCVVLNCQLMRAIYYEVCPYRT